MNRLAALSIRTKFILIMSGMTALTVLSAALIFYRHVISAYSDSYTGDLHNRAAIIGANCTAALSFSLPEDANSVLMSLQNDPSIHSAVIHDNQGQVFASYERPCRSNHEPGEHELRVREAITLDGRSLGDIVLVDDLSHVRDFRHSAMLSLVMILAVVLICSALLAMRLGGLIATPIQDLAALAARIAKEENYTLRARVDASDEVGALAEAFNVMLARVDTKTHALIASEYRFRTLVAQGVDAFFLHDQAGRFLDVNQQACDSLGYSRDELLSMTVADVDGDSVPRQDRERFWQTLTPGQALTLISRHRRRDGSFFPVEVRLGLLEIDGIRYIMGLARDISERLAEVEARHAVELQLQQAQKMESIGTLAGGIAHDFNNILSAVIGYTDLALMQTMDNGAVQENLRQVRKAGDRAADLVRQILTFSRKQQQEKQPLQVGLVIKEAMKLLRASIPSTIEIRHDITAPGMALADPTQIHQVIMNLCTNAYHAMLEHGGILSVSLKEVDIDQAIYDNGMELPAGQYLKLSVGDTGCGMDRETMAKIFEPYFTTKEKGRGTGLGLAVVHGIVKDHNGRIAVYSEPGHGTNFNVYLPMVARAEACAQPAVALPPMSKANERIMVVDDEEAIREMTSHSLLMAGYRVDLYANGAAAWEALSQSPEAWDLLLTDQTMPGMTGDQLAAKVRELRPGLPVVISSGFSENLDAKRTTALGIRAYLQKPVGFFTLLTTVAEVLGGEEGVDVTVG